MRLVVVLLTTALFAAGLERGCLRGGAPGLGEPLRWWTHTPRTVGDGIGMVVCRSSPIVDPTVAGLIMGIVASIVVTLAGWTSTEHTIVVAFGAWAVTSLLIIVGRYFLGRRGKDTP